MDERGPFRRTDDAGVRGELPRRLPARSGGRRCRVVHSAHCSRAAAVRPRKRLAPDTALALLPGGDDGPLASALRPTRPDSDGARDAGLRLLDWPPALRLVVPAPGSGGQLQARPARVGSYLGCGLAAG